MPREPSLVAAALWLGFVLHGHGAAATPLPRYSFASPRNVSFERTLFSDSAFGYRDPTAPVFDGRYWHVWATRVHGTAAGYDGVVWHMYSEVLDAEWKDGGLAIDVNRSSKDAGAWDSCGVFTPSIAWEGDGGATVPAPLATVFFLFFGGVSHPQGPIFDESLGIATASQTQLVSPPALHVFKMAPNCGFEMCFWLSDPSTCRSGGPNGQPKHVSDQPQHLSVWGSQRPTKARLGSSITDFTPHVIHRPLPRSGPGQSTRATLSSRAVTQTLRGVTQTGRVNGQVCYTSTRQNPTCCMASGACTSIRSIAHLPRTVLPQH